MSNFPYKLYASDVMGELSKSNDEKIVCKFVKELCKLCNLKQFERFETPKVVTNKKEKK